MNFTTNQSITTPPTEYNPTLSNSSTPIASNHMKERLGNKARHKRQGKKSRLKSRKKVSNQSYDSSPSPVTVELPLQKDDLPIPSNPPSPPQSPERGTESTSLHVKTDSTPNSAQGEGETAKTSPRSTIDHKKLKLNPDLPQAGVSTTRTKVRPNAHKADTTSTSNQPTGNSGKQKPKTIKPRQTNRESDPPLPETATQNPANAPTQVTNKRRKRNAQPNKNTPIPGMDHPTGKKGVQSKKFLTEIIQQNLHTEIGATCDIMRLLNPNKILALQEPYTGKTDSTHTKYLPRTAVAFETEKSKPKACIIMHKSMAKTACKLGRLTNDEIVSVKYRYGKNNTIIITSAYLSSPNNNPNIRKDTKDLLNETAKYVDAHNFAWIILTDSNGRHTEWGDKIINKRGVEIYNFIQENVLEIENITTDPTFENTRNGKSNIDITITNIKANNLTKSWRLKKTALSDHHRLHTHINLGNISEEKVKLYKNMDKTKYEQILKTEFDKIDTTPPTIVTQKYMDRKYKEIMNAFKKASDEATPTTIIVNNKTTPWSPKATEIKQKIKKAKKIKDKGHETRTEIRRLKSELNDEITHNAKKKFQETLSQIKTTKELARKMKNATKKKIDIAKLQHNDNPPTSDPDEMLKILANHHFQDDQTSRKSPHKQENKTHAPIEEQLKLKHLTKAVKNLKRNKAPGLDKITNNMIKDGWNITKTKIREYMLTSLKHNKSPRLWLRAKGSIQPKDGKKDYASPKSYRIISLTSNLLKVMESGIQSFLKEDLKINAKITQNQHGFRKGKSTISAIHQVTSKIENSLANKQIGLAAFLDIEGAFDKVSFTAIERGLDKAKVTPEIYLWISNTLRNRTVVLELAGHSLEKKILRGTPQGGILSPLLWNLCLNTITHTTIDLGLITLYADDIVILITGIDLNPTMKDKLIKEMKKIQKWINDQGLRLSTTKTKIIVFHNPRQKINLKEIEFKGEKLKTESKVMYLGLTIDKSLTYQPHIENKTNQIKHSAAPLQYLINTKWGITSNQGRYIHNNIIIPQITYAAGIWAPKALNSKTATQKLKTAQNVITRRICGAHEHTQPTVLNIIAGVEPIENTLRKEMINNYIHLKANGNWWLDPHHEKRAFLTHSKEITSLLKALKVVGDIDQTPETTITFIPNEIQTDPSINVYTDGSKIETNKQTLTGAGVVIYTQNDSIEIICPLAPTNTINQAELLAINEAAQKLINMNTKGEIIRIHTDSETTKTRLTRGFSNSDQLTNTIKNLHRLQQENQIEIVKVRAHTGIPGNEKADQLAKQATLASAETKNTLGWTKSQIIAKLEKYNKAKTLHTITESNYNKFTTKVTYKITNEYGLLQIKDKQTMRSLAMAISGQNNLNSSLAHKDPKINPNCELCGTKQNSEHVILHCPDLEHIRHNLDYTDIETNINDHNAKLDLKKLTKLIKQSGLFK